VVQSKGISRELADAGIASPGEQVQQFGYEYLRPPVQPDAQRPLRVLRLSVSFPRYFFDRRGGTGHWHDFVLPRHLVGF